MRFGYIATRHRTIVYRRISMRIIGVLVSACLLLCGLVLAQEKGVQKPAKSEAKVAEPEFPTPQYTNEDPTTYRHAIKSEANPFIAFQISMGTMIIELYPDLAPNHVQFTLDRVREGFYDGTIFHRVIDDFMAQGGGAEIGGAPKRVGYFLLAEFSGAPHYEGTLSMARMQDPHTASTQFFICLKRNQKTESLDGKYTVFGQLIAGYDVLQEIGSCPKEASRGGEISKPTQEIVLQKAFVCDPEGKMLR
jgi:cyclophilin family peptidyl-prolyl cis-trans isomerase